MPEGRPAWIRLLLLIYGSDRLSVRWSPDGSDEPPAGPTSDLAEVDPQEFDQLVRELQRQGLLEGSDGRLRLTEDPQELSYLARELQRQGLLEESDGRLRLTERGFREARRHYLNSVDRSSSDGDRDWLTLGILLVGLLTLIVASAGQLGLSTVSITFLVLVGVGVVVTVVYLAFRRNEIDEFVSDIEAPSVLHRTSDTHPVSSASPIGREGSAGTGEEEGHRDEGEETEHSEPEREETRED